MIKQVTDEGIEIDSNVIFNEENINSIVSEVIDKGYTTFENNDHAMTLLVTPKQQSDFNIFIEETEKRHIPNYDGETVIIPELQEVNNGSSYEEYEAKYPVFTKYKSYNSVSICLVTKEE